MKKKILSLLLSLTLTCSFLTACGDSSTSDSSSADSSSAAETTTTTSATTTTTSATTTTTTTTTTQATTTVPTRSSSELFTDDFIYLIPSNSADGIQFLFAAKYTGTKTINYYTITYKMYNAVGDPAYDSINNKSGFVTKTVGPVTTGKYIADQSKDRPVAYCSAINSLEVEEILLEYADGTKETINFDIKMEMWRPDISGTGWTYWDAVAINLDGNHPEFLKQ